MPRNSTRKYQGTKPAPDEVEVWKPVVGFEDLYEVSSFGRVKSRKRIQLRDYDYQGIVYPVEERILKTHIRGSRYQQVSLGRGNVFAVHRLVLEAFKGPRPKGMIACHSDDDGVNNYVGNLRWDTRKSNGEDAVKHGRQPRGELCGAHRLKEFQVIKIRELHATGRYTFTELAKMYGRDVSTIIAVVRRLNWKHIP